MIRSKIVPEDEQVHYWQVVVRCLTEFHGFTRKSAENKVRRFQEGVEALPRATAELFFHAEPFDTACRVAEKEMDVNAVLPRYLEIRDRPT
jgi:hypothetical protein